MPKWVKHIHLAALLLLCAFGHAMVPPHPLYGDIPESWEPTRVPALRNFAAGGGINSTDSPALGRKQKQGALPSKILTLMVEFSDVQFKSQPQYPDTEWGHDLAFFERWMLHLSDFFLDASHGSYEMDYTVYPQVFQLPKTLAYYGADTGGRTDTRLPEILPDLMPLTQALINFQDYDAVIIFHAGAGQEADIERIRKDSIWSTFLTRRLLQSYFDSENDDYPGFETPDGAILTNVVIVPEDEYHDYFPAEGEENAGAYLFSIYGVLAHQFGHVLGLPTLFDNDSSNGASQGIGNWGLMGTGVWNAGGYVPAQLCAFSRYYLGWEEAVTLVDDGEDFPLDHFLNHDQEAIRLYKVPISEREYYLLENRQQNPDGSLDPYQNLPSYSFKLLPEGEQEYYEDFPELPFFNFMQNRYSGSEWDFFLPGFGMDPRTDGSGILIWHIDENVIEEKFTQNFDLNRVNADAHHKGVDLVEADGFQHLDTAIMDEFKYGGYEDSYRSGNNDYFGYGLHDGLFWLPTAESHYGGIPLEIYDISASSNQMSFSLRFAWKLDAGFDGPSLLPAAAIDFDGDGSKEIFYPMSDGRLALFKNDSMAPGYPQYYQEITQLYTWDGEALYLPMQVEQLLRLARKDQNSTHFVLNLFNYAWISHPVDMGSQMVLPLKQTDSGLSEIMLYDKLTNETQPEYIMPQGELTANLLYHEQKIYGLSKTDRYHLLRKDIDSGDLQNYDLPLPADSLCIGLFAAPLKQEFNLIVQCPASIYVYELAEATNEWKLLPGFPYALPDSTFAPLTIQDFDGNGSLDLILSTANRVFIIDYSGSDMSPASLNMGLRDDRISAGALALDLDGDGKMELASALSLNRLTVWNNNYRLKSDFPISFANRGRHLPFVTQGADEDYYLWIASDNGSISRTKLPDYNPLRADESWLCEYADLRRTASRGPSTTDNQFQSDGKFVLNELYFFPNPLKKIYEPRLRLSVMPTQDMQVELKIFDISGKMVYSHSALAYAYLRNLEIFEIPAHKLSSGIYIAIISSGGETHRLRFGIEK
ncbi:MAG: immune inhibitor A [Candidatus Cloacimonadaceae bacterium]|jgi:M6 family metalloprotease-like protein|nr:immune inhibitor A [Candidatus Cloacimonadaceae bacterium]